VSFAFVATAKQLKDFSFSKTLKRFLYRCYISCFVHRWHI